MSDQYEVDKPEGEDHESDTKRRLTSKDRLVETTAGALFFGALVLLAIYTIVLSRSALFGAHHELRVAFANTQGLNPGDKILLRGMQVGKVEEVGLVPGGQEVLVTCRLTEPLIFRQDYICEVRATSMLGGKHIYVELGNPNSDPVDMNPLDGQETVDVFKKLDQATNAITSFFGNVNNSKSSSLTRIMNDEGEMYDRIGAAFASLEKSGASIDSGVTDVLDNANLAINDLRASLENLNKGQGTIGKLMTDDSLFTESKALIADLRESATRLNNPDSTLSKIAGDDGELYDTVKSSFDNLNTTVTQAREGEGTLGKLMNDPALYEETKKLMTDLQGTAARLNDPDSTLSKISSDDGALYNSVKSSFDDLSETMKTARELAEKVKNGEGTLGKLINDPALYDEAQMTIREVQGAVSDFREQAPVMTFGSLIFGSL